MNNDREYLISIKEALRELSYAKFEFAMCLFENPNLITAIHHVENAIAALDAVLDRSGERSERRAG
jgi:hypothetical protein